jgi:acyl-CoA reductase-like NAD-dependent aldehyde dehydrogenase
VSCDGEVIIQRIDSGPPHETMAVEQKTGLMLSCRNEIFGPVLTIVSADTLDDAIEIINANR